MEHNYSLSLSMPCYNEELSVKKNIPALFDYFSKKKTNLEIVAVDNGSRDKTYDNLKQLQKKYKGLKIVSLKKNQGFGGGILAGMKNASAPNIGFTCADDQITPETIYQVYTLISKNKADLAKTNRIKREDGTIRFFTSKGFNFLIATLFWLKIRDVNGYPIIIKKEFYKKMNLSKKNWMINTEILKKARVLGLRIGEVDAIFHRRTKGKTAVKISTIFHFIGQIFGFYFEYLFSKEHKEFRKKVRG